VDSFYTQEELKGLGFRNVGEDVHISRKTSIYGAGNMTIGNHVRIDDYCILSGNITVGNYVHIAAIGAIYGGAAGVEIHDFCNISGRNSFYAVSDDYSGEYLTNPMVPERYKNTIHKKIILRKHVLIGCGCTVLPGVEIGEGSSVGAMSLINKSLKPWTIYAGVPCREIKPRSRRLLELETQMMRDMGHAG